MRLINLQVIEDVFTPERKTGLERKR